MILRQLEQEKLTIVPWKSALVTLIAIQGSTCTYAKGIQDKRDLLAGLKPRAKLLLAWPGQWSQDIFDITEWRKLISV